MIKKFLISSAILGITTTIAFADNKDNSCTLKQFQPIMKRMTDMTRCWNNGDINCVVNKFYAEKFIYVGNDIVTSKKVLVNHYLQSFENKNNTSLGQLKFDLINCQFLDANHMSVLQKYILNTPEGIKQGYNLLIWKKENDDFYITTDFPRAIKPTRLPH